MKDQEWTYEKPSTWGDGLWMTEPDKVQWTDQTSGLPCLAKRDMLMGYWCGYVGVDESHPFFKIPTQDLDDLLITHGDISYANTCSGNICHVVEEGENDNVWWIGFDCFCGEDNNPLTIAIFPDERFYGTYKSLEFVKAQCASLAIQLIAIRYTPNIFLHPYPQIIT
jgi:hypothetical protein